MTDDEIWELTDEQIQAATPDELKQIKAVWSDDFNEWWALMAEHDKQQAAEEKKRNEAVKWN